MTKQHLILDLNDLGQFQDLVGKIVSQYEDESGTYLSDLYQLIQNLTLEDLNKISERAA